MSLNISAQTTEREPLNMHALAFFQTKIDLRLMEGM